MLIQESPRTYETSPVVLIDGASPAFESTIKHRAEAFIGAILVSQETHTPAYDKNIVSDAEDALLAQPLESLYDAIQVAEEGTERASEQARKMIAINVETDLYERAFKSGNITQVEMDIDAAFTMQQNGQSLESVQANSLRMMRDDPRMLERVKAETRNMFRLNQALENNWLEDNYMVVFSRAADDMELEDMERAGFFTDTMSCSIQITSLQDEKMVIESAFVAGARRPGVRRHDHRAISDLAFEIGLRPAGILAGMSATELLDSPLLIPKNRLPNGVIDLVRYYDKSAGATFFGEDRPSWNGWTGSYGKKDYEAHKQFCLERAQTFNPMTQAITDTLIAEAGTIHTRQQAVERLAELSGQYLFGRACQDETIDPMIFGKEAAHYVVEARRFWRLGEYDAFYTAVYEGSKRERSSSCPGGGRNGRQAEGYEGAASTDSGTGAEGSDKESGGECTFISKKCPECGEKNVKTTIKKVAGGKQISGDCGCKKLVK